MSVSAGETREQGARLHVGAGAHLVNVPQQEVVGHACGLHAVGVGEADRGVISVAALGKVVAGWGS